MRFVLLGDPVAHSRSPAIHNAAFAHLGIEATYGVRRCDPAGVYEAAGEIRAGELAGANVTMPHKAVAAAAADALSPEASRLKAVNTLLRRHGEVWGDNTDVAGVRHALGVVEWESSTPVLILGAGSAAAAAVAAIPQGVVTVAARRTDAAEDLATRLAASAGVVPWGSPLPGAVVINATPLGMGGESLPESVLFEAKALIDMVYGAQPTPAVELARRIGLLVADGLEMLVGQAAAAFELWTGRPAPLSVMAAAARNA